MALQCYCPNAVCFYLSHMAISQLGLGPANQHLFTITLANRVLTIFVDCLTQTPWVAQHNDETRLTMNCWTWLAKHLYSLAVYGFGFNSAMI